MRKFFALLTALSLLVFAGSAFAVTVTAAPASFSMNEGQLPTPTFTSTVTGTAAHDGQLTYAITGIEWATPVTGSGETMSVTLTPPATITEGTYTATVTVTETYVVSDAGGHSTRTETNTATITVTVGARQITPAPSITAVETAEVVAGRSTTLTLQGTPTEGLGGTLTYSITGARWASANPTTGEVKLAPGTDIVAREYPLTATVTETYTDSAGASQTATDSMTITVTVTAPTLTPEISLKETATFEPSEDGTYAPQTITVRGTRTEGFNGTLNYSVSGAPWASVNPPIGDSTTLTLSPTAAGEATITVTATERTGVYASDPVTATVAVTVYARQATEGEKEKQEDIAGGEDVPDPTVQNTEEEVVEKVVSITTEIYTPTGELVAQITTEVTINTVNNTIKVSPVTAFINSGIAPEMAKAAAQNIANATQQLISTVFSDRDDVKVLDNGNMEVTLSGGSQEDKAKEAAKVLAQIKDASMGTMNSSLVPVDFGFSLTVTKSGVSTIARDLTKNAGSKVFGYNPSTAKDVSTYGTESINAQGDAIRAAAAGSTAEEIIFLNSKGDVVDRVPDDSDPDVIPGFVTMVMYLEAGREYTPIVAVDNDDLPEDLKVEATTTEIEVLRTVRSTFTAQSNSFFTTMVSWDLIADTEDTGGYEYYRISDDTGGRVNHVTIGDDWARTDADNAAMTGNASFDLTRVVRLPALSAANESEDHVYVVKVFFQISDENRSKILASADNGAFVFFPNGPQNASARARVRKLVGENLEIMAPEDLKTGNITEGYLAFVIPAGETLTKPMLAVRLQKTQVIPTVESGDFYITASNQNVSVKLNDIATVNFTAHDNRDAVTYSVSPSASWYTLATTGNNASLVIEPTNSALIASSPNYVTVSALDSGSALSENNPYTLRIGITVTSEDTPTPTPTRGPGSSGGGCSAGFSALALAVLGAFMARRKK